MSGNYPKCECCNGEQNYGSNCFDLTLVKCECGFYHFCKWCFKIIHNIPFSFDDDYLETQSSQFLSIEQVHNAPHVSSDACQYSNLSTETKNKYKEICKQNLELNNYNIFHLFNSLSNFREKVKNIEYVMDTFLIANENSQSKLKVYADYSEKFNIYYILEKIFYLIRKQRDQYEFGIFSDANLLIISSIVKKQHSFFNKMILWYFYGKVMNNPKRYCKMIEPMTEIYTYYKKNIEYTANETILLNTFYKQVNTSTFIKNNNIPEFKLFNYEITLKLLKHPFIGGKGYKQRYLCKGCKDIFEEIKLCGKCKEVQYCSKICQSNDWKKHRQYCKK
jgi:hypothetical protein